MRKTLIVATLAALLPATVMASEGMSYTYVEAGWAQAEMDDDFYDDPKLDGEYVRGSIGLSRSFHAFGSWSRVELDDRTGPRRLGREVMLTETELGMGFHASMNDQMDFTADVAWVRAKLDRNLTVSYPYFPRPGVPAGSLTFTNASDVDFGRAMVGVRARPWVKAEGWIKGGYQKGSDIEGGWIGVVGAQFSFTPTWGLVAEYRAMENLNQATAGIRASF